MILRREAILFTDIIEKISYAPLRIRARDDAQRAPIGQIPTLLNRLRRLIGSHEAGFPRAEIDLLRQAARDAQTV